MGKPSQRKGRVGELEAAKEAEAFDLTTRVHGNYEALDISIEGDPFEVKRCEQLSIRKAYDALHAGARGQIARCNREPWLITTDFKDWLEDQRELKELRRLTSQYLPNGTEG
jgi:hypothetical protein